MRLLIVSIVFILLTPSPLYAINCELIYDEFDHLMNGSFLQRPAKFTTVKQEQFSRDDYLNQTKQLQLYPNRKNHGVAVFRTNSNTRGKFLFTWQRKQASDKHPTLLIKELVTFGRVQDGFRKRVQRNISVASSFTLDLDTGRQGGGDRADIWFNNIDGKTMYIKATNGADIYFPTTSLCKQKPKVRVTTPLKVFTPATNNLQKVPVGNNLQEVPVGNNLNEVSVGNNLNEVSVGNPVTCPSDSPKSDGIQVVKRELLTNGHVLLTYKDGSKKEVFDGGYETITTNGLRSKRLEISSMEKSAAPVALPGEPTPSFDERGWLESHRDYLLGIITELVDNPEIIDEYLTTVDNSDNIYDSIQNRSQVIELLILN